MSNPKHEALIAASPGYREFAAEMAEDPEADMAADFAEWFLALPDEAGDYSDRTASDWREEYEGWMS